jgi:hypothetical protein
MFQNRLNMLLALASEGQEARDIGFDGFFSERRIHSAKIWRANLQVSPLYPDLPTCRSHDLPISFGSAGASPSHNFAD